MAGGRGVFAVVSGVENPRGSCGEVCHDTAQKVHRPIGSIGSIAENFLVAGTVSAFATGAGHARREETDNDAEGSRGVGGGEVRPLTG